MRAPNFRISTACKRTLEAGAPARLRDLLFSNATFQWLPGHEQLFPSLLAQARPGGVLAIQMPRHIDDPSHLLILETALEARWRSRLEAHTKRLVVHTPEEYWRWLSPQSSRIDIWETIYQHELEGENPVVEFFRGSQLRPYIQALPESEAKEFVDAYAKKVARAYPETVERQNTLHHAPHFHSSRAALNCTAGVSAGSLQVLFL